MAETQNYNFYVTDDDSEYFINWRQKMNGTVNSNMTKLDGILCDKADKSTSIDVVIPAASWSGDSAPYTQNIAVEGVSGEDQNGFMTINPSATNEQKNAAIAAIIDITGQNENQITLSCSGEKPAVDIPAIVVLIN